MRSLLYRPTVTVGTVFTFCLFCLPAHGQTLTSMGPLGGDVRTLVADPMRPQVLYLGTPDGYAFGSPDAGKRWQALGRVANGVITAIVISPQNSETLFSAVWTGEANGEGGGVFVSHDGGKTWQSSGLAGHAVRALVQAPSDPNILIAGTLDGVFRSNDWGKNWERITPLSDSELRNFDSLAIDPQDPGVIYAGTFHLPWKTVDGGKSWKLIRVGMMDDSDVLSLEVNPLNPQQVLAGACSGIYRSEDAGANWRKLEGIPYSARRTLTVHQDPANPATLIAGTTEGLWKSTDGGTRWKRISPKDWVINALVMEAAARTSDANDGVEFSVAPARVLIATEDRGVLGSDDGGVRFRELNDGFHHQRVVSLAVDAEEPGRVAAVLANSPDQIVQSDNGGQNWSTIKAGLNGDSVTRIFSSPAGWLAALASGGLARFDPGTAQWLPLANTGSFHFVVNDIAFAATAWFAASPTGLFITRDNGATWTAVPFSTGNLAVDSVRASRDGQKLRIVSSNAMVFSGDAGKSWTWRDLPLDSGGAIRLESADDATLLAAARNGLYISRDDGASWKRLQMGLPAARADDLLIRDHLWLVVMHGRGLFLSQNQGASWSRMKEGDDTSIYMQPTILAKD